MKQKPRLRLRHDADWDEWQVVWYDRAGSYWKRSAEKTYHTDDKKDAVLTMADMQKRIDAKEPGYV